MKTKLLLCIFALLLSMVPVWGQMQVKNNAGDAALFITQDRRVSVGSNVAPETGVTLDVAGMTKTTSLRVSTSSAGQVLVAPGATGAATWGTVGSVGVTDNSLVADDLSVDVVSSIDGVTNDGLDIDLLAGTGIAITPNDLNKTITFALNPAITDIMPTSTYNQHPIIITNDGNYTISTTYALTEGIYLISINGDLDIGGMETAAGVVNSGWIRAYLGSTVIASLHVHNRVDFEVNSNGTTVFTVPAGGANLSMRIAKDSPDDINYSVKFWRSGGLGSPLAKVVRIK